MVSASALPDNWGVCGKSMSKSLCAGASVQLGFHREPCGSHFTPQQTQAFMLALTPEPFAASPPLTRPRLGKPAENTAVTTSRWMDSRGPTIVVMGWSCRRIPAAKRTRPESVSDYGETIGSALLLTSLHARLDRELRLEKRVMDYLHGIVNLSPYPTCLSPKHAGPEQAICFPCTHYL